MTLETINAIIEREDYRAWIVVKCIPRDKLHGILDVQAEGGYFEALSGQVISDPHVWPTHCLSLDEVARLTEEGYLAEEKQE